jgi:hypothetical protein
MSGTIQTPVNTATSNNGRSAKTEVRKDPRGRPRKPAASREAQRFAAVILEVLAGFRTPTDAAAVLGVSLPRYYQWEQRAVEGLVFACEPRHVGKVKGPQTEIKALKKEISRLHRDCVRQQALVRASQRTIGLAPPPAAAAKPKGKAPRSGTGKTRRKRRPVIRAMKAAAALRVAPALDDLPAVSSSALAEELVQHGAPSSTSRSTVPALVGSAATET